MTASYGVNGFTERPSRAPSRSTAPSACTSPTTATRRATKPPTQLAEELMGMGIECFRVEFPKGMDANEYALKVQPAAKSLGVLLNRAAWLGKGQTASSSACRFRWSCQSASAVIEPDRRASG